MLTLFESDPLSHDFMQPSMQTVVDWLNFMLGFSPIFLCFIFLITYFTIPNYKVR